jgi:hypothetical protein
MMKRIKFLTPALACAAVLMSASCTTSESPTSPSSTPPPAAPPPEPSSASVQITIQPNPVPFSGQPITDSAGCAGSKNTWFYDQILKENSGVAGTFTGRIDQFDGRVVNNVTNISITIPPMGMTTVKSRWCSSQGVAHTAQTSWSGTDAKGNLLKVDGPVVNLMSP